MGRNDPLFPVIDGERVNPTSNLLVCDEILKLAKYITMQSMYYRAYIQDSSNHFRITGSLEEMLTRYW